jgi:hypothetical protein
MHHMYRNVAGKRQMYYRARCLEAGAPENIHKNRGLKNMGPYNVIISLLVNLSLMGRAV